MGKKELDAPENTRDPISPREQWTFAIPLNRPIPHDQCRDILNGPLRDVVNLFVLRQTEYGEAANHLGAKGQFADINRKFWKLKRLMWDESVPKDAIGESAEEVLMDFIGHALLSIHYLRELEPETVSSGDCLCGSSQWLLWNSPNHNKLRPGPHHNIRCPKYVDREEAK
jgi:hypothetical protein